MSFEYEDPFSNPDSVPTNSKEKGILKLMGGSKSKNEEINICLNNVNGEILSYKIKLSDKIETLIENFRKDIGTDKKTSIIFTYQGKILDPKSTFDSIEITSDEIIQALVGLPGGNNNQH